MQVLKHLTTHICRVTATGASQSVQVADSVTGEPRGAVACRGGKVDKLRIGSILKVEAMGLTADGKLREPRLCQDAPDSWLNSY